MLRKKSGSVEWLEFHLFQQFPAIFHGVFLRHGGESRDSYSSLNFGGGSGDDAVCIERNREKVRTIVGFERWASGYQVHGSRVVEAPFDAETVECDGLITAEKGLGLLIKHADCQAAIFYDPVHQAIGCVHAGWRGNVLNIYRETVQKMAHIYGTKPADLFVAISPSLGPCCAEFVNYKLEFPERLWPYQKKPLHFDLWEVGVDQLIAAGVLPSHVEVGAICTKCHPEDFFSYRREKQSGRHGTVVCLTSDKC